MAWARRTHACMPRAEWRRGEGAWVANFARARGGRNVAAAYPYRTRRCPSVQGQLSCIHCEVSSDAPVWLRTHMLVRVTCDGIVIGTADFHPAEGLAHAPLSPAAA